MKNLSLLTVTAVMATSARASPLGGLTTLATVTTASTSQASSAPVQVLVANIAGANTEALPPAPSGLGADRQAFLTQYQPFSTAASNFIGAKSDDLFSSGGYCFAEYPCFSVSNGAVASVGSAPEVSMGQMSALLDRVLAQPVVTFDNSNSDTVMTGFKTTQQGAVLEIITPAGTMDSQVVAGMAFDMFKLQSNDGKTNAIRAVQASSDGQAAPILALCVYPDLGSDAASTKAMQNFCVGKELDGSAMPARPAMAKRFSIETILGGFCALIDIPLLCPSTGG